MLSHTDFLVAEMWKKKMWGKRGKEHMQDINKNCTPQEGLVREMRCLLIHSHRYE